MSIWLDELSETKHEVLWPTSTNLSNNVTIRGRLEE